MTTAETASTQSQPTPRAVSINCLQSIRRTGREKSTTRAQQGAQSPPIHENDGRKDAGERAAEPWFHRSSPAKFIDRLKLSSNESASTRIMALRARSVCRIRKTARPLGGFANPVATPFVGTLTVSSGSAHSAATVGNAASGSALRRIMTASDALRSRHN